MGKRRIAISMFSAGVMAVMAISDTAKFDIKKARGKKF